MSNKPEANIRLLPPDGSLAMNEHGQLCKVEPRPEVRDGVAWLKGGQTYRLVPLRPPTTPVVFEDY